MMISRSVIIGAVIGGVAALFVLGTLIMWAVVRGASPRPRGPHPPPSAAGARFAGVTRRSASAP